MKNIRLIISAFCAITVLSICNNSYSSENRIDGDGWYGCSSKEYYEKLVVLVDDGDKEAFSKALTAGIMGGVCVSFKGGERVYIDDTDYSSGIVNIRREGSVSGYWIKSGAVKD